MNAVQTRFFFYLILASNFWATVEPWAALVPECPLALKTSSLIHYKKNGEITVDNVVVTGNTAISILRSLSLGPEDLARWAEQKSLVISVAEGTSELLPKLLEKGVNAYGLDLWYDPNLEFPDSIIGEEMRSYLAKYQNHLIRADARQLPYFDNTVDVVLSHKLVNNQEISEALRFVAEALRVVKIGGEVRIYGFSGLNSHLLEVYLNKNFPAEKNNYLISGGLFVYRKKRVNSRFKFFFNFGIPYGSF